MLPFPSEPHSVSAGPLEGSHPPEHYARVIAGAVVEVLERIVGAGGACAFVLLVVVHRMPCYRCVCSHVQQAPGKVPCKGLALMNPLKQVVWRMLHVLQ
jgi:hypothetical protein